MNGETPRTFSVLLAADLIPRVTLCSRLFQNESVRIVGEASVAGEVLFVTHLCAPDAVVLDIRMGGLSSIRGIRNTAPDCVLIVLADAFTSPLRKECGRCGANYFFDQNSDLSDVVSLLERLAIDPQLRRRSPADGSSNAESSQAEVEISCDHKTKSDTRSQ